MEHPTHTFDTEQASYLARVLNELDIRISSLRSASPLKYSNGLPAFRVHRNGVNGAAFASGVPVKITFTTASFNTVAGSFDFGTSEYVVPYTGIYCFNVSASSVSSDISLAVGIDVNGTRVSANTHINTGASGSALLSSITDTLSLNAGDKVSASVFWVSVGSFAVYGLPDITNFSGFKVE
jgi:ABC-type Fe3+-siderophore transport system permease subunit